MKTLYESITQSVDESILDIDGNTAELGNLADKLSECYGYSFHNIYMYKIRHFEDLKNYAESEGKDIVAAAKYFIDAVETDKFYVKHHFEELKFKLDHIDYSMNYYEASDLDNGGDWVIHDPTSIHLDGEPLKANIFALCHQMNPRSKVLTVKEIIMDESYKGVNWNRMWPKYSDNFPIKYTSSIEESEKLIKKEAGGRSRNW